MPRRSDRLRCAGCPRHPGPRAIRGRLGLPLRLNVPLIEYHALLAVLSVLLRLSLWRHLRFIRLLRAKLYCRLRLFDLCLWNLVLRLDQQSSFLNNLGLVERGRTQRVLDEGVAVSLAPLALATLATDAARLQVCSAGGGGAGAAPKAVPPLGDSRRHLLFIVVHCCLVLR